MRIGAVLSPVPRWDSTVEAARMADELGFDSLGLWDHYHSLKPEWAYIGLGADDMPARLRQLEPLLG